jgi:exopolysaccharide biosynthesis polyprenyl glycosylphosphotransferase
LNRKVLKFIVFLVDFLLIHLSLLLVLFLRYGIEKLRSEWMLHFPLFGFISLIWLLSLYIANLYNITEPLNYRNFWISMAINVGLAISFFYVFPNIPITPKTNLGLIVGFFVALFLIWRNILEHFLDRLGIQRSLVFVGVDEHSLELAGKLMNNPRLGYTVSAFVVGDDTSESEKLPEWLKSGSVILIHSMEELSVYLGKQGTHSIIVSEVWYRNVHQHLYTLFPKGVRMYHLSTFWEQMEETIPVNATDELWFLQNMSRGPYSIYHKLKRFFDIFVTLIFLPLILFFCLVTFLLVKISSRGPSIYKQVRVGLGNREFTLYKFRSMQMDAEKNGAVWASKKDSRLTPVGNFIRRFRLDELPQIFNVLKGDMSIVGPRPERPEFVKHLVLDIPHYNLRHLTKPGLTGWAQVKYRYGASVKDAEIKLMYDLFYVKNVSPLLDMRIGLKTILTVLTKSGR